MRPVGPQPEQVYWRRRLLVMAAALLLVALVVALVVAGTSTGSAVSAQPSPPPVTAPAPASVTPSAFATPSVTTTPSVTSTPSSTAASDPASPQPSLSAGSSASASASSSRSPSASTSPKASPSPSPKRTKTAPARCSASDLRTTLVGKQKLKPKQATTFALSLINGSDATCIVSVQPTSFELKIYSGTDRIWSTRDCSTAVKTVRKKLAGEQALEWTMAWNGRRSRDNCKNRAEIPKPGTYFATAQLDGAKPVQLRMILVG
jgi:hypothetical protein